MGSEILAAASAVQAEASTSSSGNTKEIVSMVIADLKSKGLLSTAQAQVASNPAASQAAATVASSSESSVIGKLSSIIDRCQKSKQKKKNNSD